MNDNASGAAPRSGGPPDPDAIDDLVAANRILADQGVLDGYGHVSMRHGGAANRYFL
jgi:HCOMODA/2-hydroxy-3-carboxy-muconic semialdehyde decarboxylase